MQLEASDHRVRSLSNLVPYHPVFSDIYHEIVSVFDQFYYSEQRGRVFESVADAYQDYIDHGWRGGLRASRWFDELFYLEANADLQHGGVMPPLEHYLRFGVKEGRQPHPLLTWRKHHNRPGDRVWASIAEYRNQRPSTRKHNSAFFSDRWYRIQEPELASDADALAHYLHVGAAKGHTPFPAMDVEYYAKSHMSDADRAAMTVLEHFERHPLPRPKTFALFDEKYYRQSQGDLSGERCVVSHFAKFGVWERRPFSRLLSEAYMAGLFPELTFSDRPVLGEYLRRGKSRRPRLIFVGHEGSRTGAPGILLKLVQQVAALDVECYSIIDQDGPLVGEHALVSHVLKPETHRFHVYHHGTPRAHFEAALLTLLDQMDDCAPIAAICNSAESRLYGAAFAAAGVRVITLMHEIATFYPERELRLVQDTSDLLVFPAEFVKRAMQLKAPSTRDNTAVIPQGVLRETYGMRPRGDRDMVFAPYGGVADDEILVIGCGTLDGRKGIDLFVNVAKLVRERAPEAKIRFAWVGGRRDWKINEGATWDTSGFWAHYDLMATSLADEVRIISEVPDTEPFLVNADIFLMTSRADPFPCVVHEAMACGLPIVAFDGAGGAPEAFLPDAGATVPYIDAAAMADEVIRLARDRAARSRMGAAGKQIVTDRYRFSDYTRRIVNEVERLADVPRGTLGDVAEKKSRGRIYFTVPLWTVSGVNTMTEALVNSLNEQGFEAEILLTCGWWGQPFVPGGDFFERTKEYMPQARTHVMHPASLSPADRERDLAAFLTRNAPCIFVPGYDYIAAETIRRLPATVGVVGVIHSDDREHYAHAQRLGHLWNRAVTVSTATTERLKHLLPGLAERTQMIRYGLQPPPPADLGKALDAKMSDGGPIRLVFAGRFEVLQKRIGDYPKLAHALAAAGTPYELIMVGEGSQTAAVSVALNAEVLAGRVHLPGRLDHAETLATFDGADVVLILSDFEGLPLSLIEGMQRGCIPVVYDMPSGIPDVIEDGRNGFIVPRGDIGEVAARIAELQRDSALRTRMRKAALETSAAKGLTLEDMGRSYGDLFEEVFLELAAGDRDRQVRRSLLEA